MNRILVFFFCVLCMMAAAAMPQPDSAGVPPLPGPGLSYGGIPYGSMSGNVAEYFKRQAPSSGARGNYAGYSHTVDFTPIQHWL